ncbi:hypothetical protein [Anaerosoma tenue]|uniref:hypothetical protein n=1 Tax=Anaerosoma tenue TaxID=2933588 RepID=UPI002260C822|nr:hypothetical protein [Anaerosoma tenue]MCK8114793.1 hypothetical protein [Anaerosoma tenue]
MQEPNGSREWLLFVATLKALLEVRLRRPGKPNLNAYRQFIDEACGALRQDAFIRELDKALTANDAETGVEDAFKRLLRLEIAAFGDSYMEVTDRDPLHEVQDARRVAPPVKGQWIHKTATAGDMLGAGRTVLGSLREGLDLLPAWARGILKAGEEAVSIVA